MFKLKNIDRAIEWALRDAVIAANLWPDQRAALAGGDMAAYNTALAAMNPKIDIFGVGNYSDKEQLRANNLIIERTDIDDGDIAFAEPYRFQLKPDKTYDKIKTPDGTKHIIYRLRFVCDDVSLDRTINEIIAKVFGRRTTFYGMNDDLSNMTDTFDVYRYGNAVDLSDKNFIERVYDFQVRDVLLDLEEVIDNIPAVTSISDPVLNPGPRGYDVRYPDRHADITLGIDPMSLYDYFLHVMLDAFPLFASFDIVRLYAQSSQAMALKNFVVPLDAINTGLTFTPYKGFSKTSAPQYLNIGWQPPLLTSYSYSVFTTDVPATGLFEMFGLVNPSTSFYMRSNAASGIQAKGNSNTELPLTIKAKPYTLYTLNRRNRFDMEIWEGNKMIGVVNQEPTAIPEGSVFELNISDDAGLPVGVSVAGGLAFSCAGTSLKGSEIERLNRIVRETLTKLGVIP